MAEKTGCRSRMESTFKNNYELDSNTKKRYRKYCSSIEEHAEYMGVLYLQFSHLARISEQLLELNLALKSCKINYFHIINLSGPNYYTHAMPEKMGKPLYSTPYLPFHVQAIIQDSQSHRSTAVDKE